MSSEEIFFRVLELMAIAVAIYLAHKRIKQFDQKVNQDRKIFLEQLRRELASGKGGIPPKEVLDYEKAVDDWIKKD